MRKTNLFCIVCADSYERWPLGPISTHPTCSEKCRLKHYHSEKRKQRPPRILVCRNCAISRRLPASETVTGALNVVKIFRTTCSELPKRPS